MKVLDAKFLIDYLDGVESTRDYLLEHDDETYVLPVPAYGEVLLGEGNGPGGDIEGARQDLSWGEVYAIDEHTAVTAAKIADEVGRGGPFLSGMDALIAAVGRELDATVVSHDRHLTHPEIEEKLGAIPRQQRWLKQRTNRKPSPLQGPVGCHSRGALTGPDSQDRSS